MCEKELHYYYDCPPHPMQNGIYLVLLFILTKTNICFIVIVMPLGFLRSCQFTYFQMIIKNYFGFGKVGGGANVLTKPTRECPTRVLFLVTSSTVCHTYCIVQPSFPNQARRTEKVQQRAQTEWGTILLLILKPFSCLDFPWHFALLFYCGEENTNGWEIINSADKKLGDSCEGFQ